MAEEEVGLRLSLKNRREVARGVHQVGDELDRVGDQAARASRQSRFAARGIAGLGRAGRTAGRVAVAGIAAITAAVVAAGYAATRLVQSSLSEAREAQKVSAVTRAEIKATGGVANVTAKSMSRLANAISRKVGMDDEAIQSGANLLLTFKNVRNEQGKGNKIFDQATQAAVDLSAAGFGSIESGSKMLGKALNDPLKGITALSRAGVTFSAEQVERIERFVEENKLLEAQKVILGEVRSQVGGVAAEQATWGDHARVLWGNLQERLGTALLPLLDRLSRWFVREGGPKVDHFFGLFIDKGIPAIEDFARKGVAKFGQIREKVEPLARELLPEVWGAVKKIGHWAGIAADKATGLVKAFANMPEWAKTLIIGGATAGWLATKIPGLPGIASSVLRGGVQKVFETNPAALGGGIPGGVPGGGRVPPVVAGPTSVFGKLATRFPKIAKAGKGLGWVMIGQSIYEVLLGDTYGLVDESSKRAAINTPGERASTPFGSGLQRPTAETGTPGADVAGDGFGAFHTAAKGVGTLTGGLGSLTTASERADAAGKALNARFEAVMTAAGFGTAEVVGLAHGLGDLGRQHPQPNVEVRGIPESGDRINAFIRGPLGDVQRPVAARIGAETGDAVAKVNELGRLIAGLSRNVTVGVDVANNGVEFRAAGGPVRAGRTYVVGEDGPELLRMGAGVNGYVHPRVNRFNHPRLPDMPRFDDEDWGAGGGRGLDAAGAPVNLHFRLDVDGRELGRVVLEDFQDRVARA